MLLLVGLGGCRIFHPDRLPTPKPSPEFKAQQKEAEARKKANGKAAGGLFQKKVVASEEAATDVSTPSGAATATPTAAAAAARTLPERSTVRYDKQGLMKKPKLMRRRVNKPSKSFRPWQSIRSFFKFGLHAKPNYSPDHRPAPKQPRLAPDETLPDEAMPAPAPDAGPTGKP